MIPRREFLGAFTAISPITDATSGVADEGVSESSVRRAIADSRSHLFDVARRTEETYWSTPVRYGEYGNLRRTLYYALLLQRMGIRPGQKQELVSYLLDHRTSGGGWEDPVTDYGVLLLLREADDLEYDHVLDDVKAEIAQENYEIRPSAGGDESTEMMSSMYKMRLLYAVMSDRHSYAELFPDDVPLKIAALLAPTPALEGDEIDVEETMIRPIFIGTLTAYYLMAVTARDESVDDEELVDGVEEILLSRRLTNGAWSSSTTSIFGTFALYERGYDPTDEEIRQVVDWITETRVTDEGRVEIWRLPVWDTGLVMEALLAAGVSPDSQILRESARWLYRARTTRMVANPRDIALNRPPAPFRRHYGNGWGYDGPQLSDWDDTALAINVLSAFGGDYLDKDVQFLLDVQNSDGSWSTYLEDYDPLSESEKAELRPKIGDGSYRLLFGRVRSPDVTGGILTALSKRGRTARNSESVREAVRYLRDARADNDMWLGVWGQGYTYGTARVLRGLKHAGIDAERPFVRRAADALVARQNPDGGWGEDSRYAPSDPTPGNGEYRSAESTPTQTAWALKALLSADVPPDHPAVQNGVAYLLRSQRSDGSWEVHRVMYNFGGPGYSTTATTQAAALKALAMYARTVGLSLGDPSPTDGVDALPTTQLLESGAMTLTASLALWYELSRRGE